MGPISAVGVGPSMQPAAEPNGTPAAQDGGAPLSSAAAQTGNAAPAGAVGGGFQAASSSVVHSSVTITNVQSAVADLLRSIDEDLANNQMLRLLIGLMILMAFLQSEDTDGGSSARELSGLPGSGVQSQFSGAFASSSTIHTQQFVSTSWAVSAFDTTGASESESPSSGGQIDVSG